MAASLGSLSRLMVTLRPVASRVVTRGLSFSMLLRARTKVHLALPNGHGFAQTLRTAGKPAGTLLLFRGESREKSTDSQQVVL